jgi:tetratricopeptide (TPR) repeat protein
MRLFARTGLFRDRSMFINSIASLAIVAALALVPSSARAQINPPPPPPPPGSQSQPPSQAAPPSQTPPPSSEESSSKSTPDGMEPLHLGSVPPPPPTQPSGAGLPGDAEPLPAFEPLEAKKDCEVGSFYMKQGKFDAAIDRFIDATHAMPTYAMPWQLMGEAYDKKGDYENSIKAYQKFLKLYPHAPDRKKIEDHIADMQKRLDKDMQKHSGK